LTDPHQVDHTFVLVLQNSGDHPTALSQILALIKRSDSIPIKSEGTRVLVNVIKSLWYNERGVEFSDERQKKKDACMTAVLTKECASTLTNLIWRSGKYPVLVNEGIVAMTLLCTHPAGGEQKHICIMTLILRSSHLGALVLEALTMPLNEKSVTDGLSPVSTAIKTIESPPTPISLNDGPRVLENALDMLVSVLRNVDNSINFPIEVRVNTCTFFLQLQKHVSSDSLAPIRATVLPVLQQIIEDSQEVQEDEKLIKVANLLITNWTISRPST
jgi:hypothetical protein